MPRNDQAGLQPHHNSGLPACLDAGGATPRTHFAVPAREMLFDEPEVCPAYGGLTFDGIAVTAADEMHLILRVPTARAYFGPDGETISRRGLILLAALRDSALPPRPADMPMLMLWLMTCWTTTLAEIEAAGTKPESTDGHGGGAGRDSENALGAGRIGFLRTIFRLARRASRRCNYLIGVVWCQRYSMNRIWCRRSVWFRP